MPRFAAVLSMLVAAAASQPVLAQSSNIPGVTEAAPGVQSIDGAKVPSTRLSVSALKAAIEGDRSYSKIKRLFTVAGIASPGPAGTTTYMFKVHDTDTDKDVVAILFVKGGSILNYMIS